MSKRPLLMILSVVLLGGAASCDSTPATPTTPTSTTVTEVFASRIQERGSAWRSVTVTTGGTVTVQLTSVSQAGVVVGLGLGTVVGTDCVLSQSIQTAASSAAGSPQITATLGSGTYCVKFWDVGNLTTIVDFSITITKPA